MGDEEEEVESPHLKIIDFSVGCCENRCTDRRTINRFTASKCKWYVNSLQENIELIF